MYSFQQRLVIGLVGSRHQIRNLILTNVPAHPICNALEERRAITQDVAELLGLLVACDSTREASQAGTIAARKYHTPASAAWSSKRYSRFIILHHEFRCR
jgi:hypothetical protein